MNEFLNDRSFLSERWIEREKFWFWTRKWTPFTFLAGEREREFERQNSRTGHTLILGEIIETE